VQWLFTGAIPLLSSTREQLTYKENPVRLYQLIFQQKHCRGQKGVAGYIQNAEREKTKTCNQEYPTRQGYYSEQRREKAFPKQKLKEFITTKPALQETLKGILLVERKHPNQE